MSEVQWSAQFEAILRQYLRHLPDDAALNANDNLVALGVDSLDMITLLVALEDAFTVVLPDELLTSDTFATPQSLWSALAALVSPRPEMDST